MPTVPFPLFSKTYKNIDGSILSDDSNLQYNGFLDELGGITIRPGEVLAINSGAQNDGLFKWPDKNFIIGVNSGDVRFYTVSGQTLISAIACGSVTFPAGVPVTFCTDGTYVFMAGGGKINYVDIAGTLTELGDSDAPTTVTHVAFLDGYIIAIDGTGRFFWSNINASTDWSALNFATAEGSPDNTKALHIVQRQIYLLGTVSTEIWENDGETPFVRIPGGLIEMGCIAPYSPIKFDNSLIWLNHDRQFVQFTGTAIKYLSGRYNKIIENFTIVYDCISGIIRKDGQIFLIFQFPMENRTLVYNPALEDWSEWAVWNSDTMSWNSYDFRSTVKDINSGQTFVGKGSAAVISCLDSNSRVDLTGSATTRPFKFLRQTGHIDHGTGQKKRLEELRFRARRGAYVTGDTPELMLRYRNDGSSQWSNIINIDLGTTGVTEHHIKLKRLGMYKSRQFEISATDNVPIVLSNAEGDITVLR